MAERPRGVARRVAWSATLTVVSLAMFETLAQIGGWIPEPVGLLALVVVSCAFVGGSQGGLMSAALCVVFAVIAGPLGSRMFPADDALFGRAAIAAYALPALALLVGGLRIQAQNRLARYRNARAEADVADQRYRELIVGLGGICWEVRVPGHEVEFVSGNAAAVFGYPVTEWLDGNRIWDVLLPRAECAQVRAAFDEAALASGPVVIDHRAITRTGDPLEVRTVLRSRSSDRSEVGTVQGATVVRGPEPRAATVDAAGLAVFEELPAPVLVHDAGGRLVDANPAACAALGYDREELIGLELAGIGLEPIEPGADGRAVPALLRRKDGRQVLLNLRVLHLPRPGRPLTVLYAASPDVAT